MKFYGITMQGKFINQTLSDVPATFDPSTDIGRLIYNEADGFLWWGDGNSNIWRSIGEGGGDASEHEDMYSDLLRTSIFLNAHWNEFWQNMGVDPFIDENLSDAILSTNWNADLKSYRFTAVGQELVSTNIFDENLSISNVTYAMPSVYWFDGVVDGSRDNEPLIYLNCTTDESKWEGPCTNNDVWRFENTPTTKHVRMKIVSTGTGYVLSWGLLYNKDLSVSCSKYALTQFEINITDPVTENPIVVDYIPGYVMVFLNGVLLQDTEDYTATDGAAILIHDPDIQIGDVINVISFGTSTFGGGASAVSDLYIRRDASLPWEASKEQSVNQGKFTNLGDGSGLQDSVNIRQLDETYTDSPNRHQRLYASDDTTVVAQSSTGTLDVKSNRIVDVGNATTGTDALNRDTADGRYVNITGDSMSSGTGLNMNSQRLYGLQDGDATGEAVHYGQFAFSAGTQGYQKLPSGITFAWGRTAITPSIGVGSYATTSAINYGITFLSVYNIQLANMRNTSGSDEAEILAAVATYGLSSFTAYYTRLQATWSAGHSFYLNWFITGLS